MLHIPAKAGRILRIVRGIIYGLEKRANSLIKLTSIIGGKGEALSPSPMA